MDDRIESRGYNNKKITKSFKLYKTLETVPRKKYLFKCQCAVYYIVYYISKTFSYVGITN